MRESGRAAADGFVSHRTAVLQGKFLKPAQGRSLPKENAFTSDTRKINHVTSNFAVFIVGADGPDVHLVAGRDRHELELLRIRELPLRCRVLR